MTTAESTEHRAAVKRPTHSWKDFATEQSDAAIIYLSSHEDFRDGYYVVKVKARDARGNVVKWSLPCAHRETPEAAQFALDQWAGRCVRGERVSSDDMLHEYALALEKGLVKPMSDTERAKALVDEHHERQGLKDLWPITGVDHYLLDGHDLYVVVCTRVSTIIFPDESVQHRCFVHCDLVAKRGGVLVVIAPCDDQESEGEL